MNSFEIANSKQLREIAMSGMPVTLVDNSRERTQNYHGNLKIISDQGGDRYLFEEEDTHATRSLYKKDDLSFDYRPNGVVIELDSSARRNKRRAA